MVHLNQFSRIEKSHDEMLSELSELGFKVDFSLSAKEIFRDWLQWSPAELTSLQASENLSLLDFISSDEKLDWSIFYCLGLQLLDFVVNFDFLPAASLDFAEKTGLYTQKGPVSPDSLLLAIYQLMATRSKLGMTLIEKWVSEDLLPVDNQFYFFNDKSLATFDMGKLKREVVYVESPVDSFGRGHYDLIKVQILRPEFSGKLPVVMTASPYHLGTNDIAATKQTHEMTGELAEKTPHEITVQTKFPDLPNYPQKEDYPLASEATEHFVHNWTSSLNDYLLARGFASVYVAGVGTRGSDGMQTSGDYQQIYSMKAAIDWLNGRTRAFVDKQRSSEIRADWASGKVATTGKSYLGTMSYGLATTGIEGLEVILAESGISSWYDYYREGGLVRSPGGFPGEDLDVLAELTYSRNLDGADYLRGNKDYQTALSALTKKLERKNGDYNQFWDDRNYLNHIENVHCDVLIEHGLQDWNVMPGQAYHFWKALPSTVTKHAFLHRGAHVYSNSWQSFDYSEIVNSYFTAKLLDRPLTLNLAPIIIQENGKYESWSSFSDWGKTDKSQLPLGSETVSFENHYSEETFKKYSTNFELFKKDLFEGRANASVIDLKIPQDLLINGEINLELRLKTSDSKAFISAQLLDFGEKKRLRDSANPLEANALDRGRNFMLENLGELPFVNQPYQLISKGFLNLQNRAGLQKIDSIQPDEWMTVSFQLQPTIYQLAAGDQIRLVLYSTDFEHTIRDNRDCQTSIDLSQSQLIFSADSKEQSYA